MKNIFLLFGSFFLTAFFAASQSIYNIEYNFFLANDSTTYRAFLIRFDDGSGLLRVRYTDSQTNDDIVKEMDIEELTPLENSRLPDSNFLLLKATNPRTIVGDAKKNFTPPIFSFRHNPATDYFEPEAISLSDIKFSMPQRTYFAARLMERAALNKDFVLQFFSEDEEFYTNLFINKTKGLTPLEKNIKFYLLVVADTLDKEIGTSCSKDVRRTIETFTALTNFLGIKIFTKTICGAMYSKKNVQDAISALRPSANDIVVFYYSGHGFRLPEQPRRFPFIKLKTLHKSRKDVLDNSLNMEDIFLSITKKGARFNLVLSDCCINDIFSSNATGTKPGKTKGSGVEWSEDNLRTLFLNKTPMSLLATAASTGQKATSNNDFGGFFSYYFKTSMENYSSKLRTNGTWDVIMQDAQKQTIFKAKHTYCEKPYIPENICQQNPDYKIVFGR